MRSDSRNTPDIDNQGRLERRQTGARASAGMLAAISLALLAIVGLVLGQCAWANRGLSVVAFAMLTSAILIIIARATTQRFAPAARQLRGSLPRR